MEFEVEKVGVLSAETGELTYRYAVIDRNEERLARFDTLEEAQAEASRRNGMHCTHELVAIRHRTLGPGGGAFCARCGATIGKKVRG